MKINQKQLENIVEKASKHALKKIVNEALTFPHKMIGNKGYQYIPLKTFEDAQKFGETCPMTFCHAEKWFNWFGEHGCQLVCFLGKKTFFVCIKNGSIDEIRHSNGEQCELEEFEEETGITPEDIRNISSSSLNESRNKRTLKNENMKINQKQLEAIVENATKVALKKMLKENLLPSQDDSNMNTSNRVGNGYTFDITYSQAECAKYERPTAPGAWCMTYGQSHFDHYVKMLNIHFVIFRKDGWESIKRPADPMNEPGFTPEKPHDEYGNSLIAMLQSNDSPEPVYISSRWNHGYQVRCEGDHAYTKQEFQQITGVTDEDLKRIYEIWKSNAPQSKRRRK